MARRERNILERSVDAIAEQAVKTNHVIDQAMEAGLAADHPVTVAAKQLRLEGRPGAGTREAGPQLHRLRSGGALGPGHQYGGPRALGTSLSSAARRASHLGLSTDASHPQGGLRSLLDAAVDATWGLSDEPRLTVFCATSFTRNIGDRRCL